jgi:IclR family acetate operon transcriptional repressor
VPNPGSKSVADGKAPRYPIESVANGAKLLGLFRDRTELRLSDVAHSLEVSPSTAHRLLTTLESEDLVRQDPTTRCYLPGPVLLSIAQALVPRDSRWAFARPFMAGLSERVGETVNLQVLHGAQAAFVESVEASSSVRVGSRLGALMPAHCTSGGKLLLSLLSEDELLQLFPTEALEQSTDKSLMSRRDLVAELKRVAKRGYATNFGESEPGISGVAVLVPGLTSPRVVLAVSVPSPRLAPARVQELVSELRSTADALGAVDASPM